jgi:hypothetical protein
MLSAVISGNTKAKVQVTLKLTFGKQVVVFGRLSWLRIEFSGGYESSVPLLTTTTTTTTTTTPKTS